MSDMPWRSLRLLAGVMVKRNLDLTVEGAANLPATGPVIIASRHFHHLYDGCVLVSTIPRPSHVLVAGDWTRNPLAKAMLDRACKAARWPMVLRPGGPTNVSRADAADAFRRATSRAIELFRAGRPLIVFPEGYPNIDPGFTPKTDEAMFLPFQRGIVRLATLAADAGITVPIVPAGLSYTRSGSDRWNVGLRFCSPVLLVDRRDEVPTLRHLEDQVRQLSRQVSFVDAEAGQGQVTKSPFVATKTED